MKKLILFLTLLCSLPATAQKQGKTVIIIVTGQGETIEKARNNALRSAIEQAFGAYVSSKTEILKEDLISDNITTISNGNIQKFAVLDETVFNQNSFSVTVKAEVSLDKLATFLNQNGMSVTVNGELIANNYLLKDIYEKNEIDAAVNYFNSLKSNFSSKNLFEIELTATDPFRAISGQNFLVPMRLKISPKEGIKTLVSSSINFLKSISIDKDNIKSYIQMNLPIYPLIINDGNKSTILYFRNPKTILQIEGFYELYYNNISNIKISNEIRDKSLTEFGDFQSFHKGWLGTEWFQENIYFLKRPFSGFVNGLKDGVTNKNSDINLFQPIYFNDSFFSSTKVTRIQMDKLSTKQLLELMLTLKGYENKINDFSSSNLGGLAYQSLDLFIVDEVSFEDLKKMKKYSIVNE